MYRSHKSSNHFSRALGRHHIVGLTLLALLATTQVWGAAKTWDNGAGDNLWSSGNNWNSNGVPVAGDSTTFNGSNTTNSFVDAGAGFGGTVASLTVTAGYTGTIQQTRGTLTITGNVSIAGGTYDLNGQTLVVNGTFTLSGGTFTCGSGTLRVGGNFAITGGTFNAGTGIVDLTRNSTQTFNGGGATFNTITHSGSGTLQINTNNINLTGDLNNNAGTLNPNTHSITANATGTLSNLGTLLVDASTYSGNYSNFLFQSHFAGSTVNYNANAAQAVENSVNIIYSNLIVSGTGTKTASGPISTTNFTVSTGTTFDPAGQVIDSDATGTLSNSGTLLVDLATFSGLTGNYTDFATITLNAGSTVTYDALGDQTVDSTLTYSSLRITGSGTKTADGDLTLNSGQYTQDAATFDLNGHTLDINRSPATAPAGSFTLSGGIFDTNLTGLNLTPGTITLENDWVSTAGTFTARPNSLVEFTGSNSGTTHSIDTTAANAFFNLSHTNSGGATLTLQLNTVVTVLGALTQSVGTLDLNGHTLTVNGTAALSGGTLSGDNSANSVLVVNGDLTTGSSLTQSPSVTVSGTAAQALQGFGPGNTLRNLTIGGTGGVKTVTGIFTVTNTLTVNNTGPVADILTITDAATSYINLSTTGVLVDNSLENIKGQIRATRTINNGNTNAFGNIGVSISDVTGGSSPGSTTVRRFSKTVGIPSYEVAPGVLSLAANRLWFIQPTNTTNQNASVTFASLYLNEFAGDPLTLNTYHNNGTDWEFAVAGTGPTPEITDFTNAAWTFGASIGAVTDTDVVDNAVADITVVGTPVHITALATDPTVANTVSYSLTVNPNGWFAIDPVTGVITVADVTGFDTAFSINPGLDIPVEVLATTDGGGVSRTLFIIVGTQNQAPSIDSTAITNSVLEGGTATLTGTFSDQNPNDYPFVLTVNWHDGTAPVTYTVTTGLSFSVTHIMVDDIPSATSSDLIFPSAFITDKYGVASSTVSSAGVIVINTNPNIAINGAPATGNGGVEISLTSTVTDAGTDTFTYAWSVTRNGLEYTGSGNAGPFTGAGFKFTPTLNGSYIVKLTVTDDDNGVSSVSTGAIVVSDVNPAIVSGPTVDINPAKPLQVVHFFGQAEGDSVVLTWNFGDGTIDTSNSTSVAHAFSPAGNYTVTLTATDAANHTTSKSLVMTIDPNQGAGSQPGAEVDNDGDGVSDALEIAAGTDPLKASSSPLTGGPGGAPRVLFVSKMGIKLDFVRANNDSLTLAGLLPVPAAFTPAGKTLLIDIGGAIRKFTLDGKGGAKAGTDSVKLQSKRVGALNDQLAKLTIKYSREALAASFADEGMTKEAAIALPTLTITLILDTTMYQTSRNVLYTNAKGTLGVVK